MNEYVVDTHALFWSLTNKKKLGVNALAAFVAGEKGEARLYLPSIVLAELYYLNAKQGSPLDYAEVYTKLLAAGQFDMIAFGPDETLRFDQLKAIPEMHDRIIAGVALAHDCPCITLDPAIVSSGLVKTIW